MGLILAVFIVTTLAQSFAVPVFEGSDEQRHYAYARYLVNHLALPPRPTQINPAGPEYVSYQVGQEAGQPPLYYISVALLTAFVPDADNTTAFVVPNPFVTPAEDYGQAQDNDNAYLHGPEGAFPFHGVALAVHLGRLVSVVAGIVTLLAVYQIGRTLTPENPAIALLATALISTVPGFQFIFAVITNDAATIMFATLCIWVAVRIAQEGPTRGLILLGGIFGGLATLSKVNGAFAVAVVWLALLAAGITQYRGRTIDRRLGPLFACMVIWFAISGWWLIYGALAYGDPTGLAVHIAVKQGESLLSFAMPDLSLINSTNLALWDRTTWYSAGWSMTKGPDWIYDVFRTLYLGGLLGGIGLALQAATGVIRTRRVSRVSSLQVFYLCLIIVITLVMAVFWQSTGRNRLGRYLYPGLTSAAVIAALGWAWWLHWFDAINRRLPRTTHVLFALIVSVLMYGAAFYTTYYTISDFSPHQIMTTVPEDVTKTQVTFLDPQDKRTPVAEITGYRIHYDDFRKGSAMLADICWKSLAYTRRSFPYTMQLVGPNDTRVGTRNSYHGLGSYPITAWLPGGEFCDQTALVITLPIDRPRAYNLVVSLFDLDSENNDIDAELPALDGNGRPTYPVISRVRVAPDVMPVVTPTASIGDFAGLADTRVELQSGNVLSVTLRWVALQSSVINAKAFFHVADRASSKLLAQSDHVPDGGWFPTNYWLENDVIEDQFTVQLPVGTDLSQVSFTAGMYDANSLVRLTAVDLATGSRYADDNVPIMPQVSN